ncbi:MAG: hypothetical protein L0Y74_11110 [candidate division Zixibacteria bacterium]|nr:hypothetical protein [candidate division Zixibacteria bacterium]
MAGALIQFSDQSGSENNVSFDAFYQTVQLNQQRGTRVTGESNLPILSGYTPQPEEKK